ncbi:hypothetical protein ACFW16_30775 [Inquilinus sp. NPDC058860]|uniref:hypothetical protein n=1 Tax=Inquilinus sp. NPDC058860 TaxID=3346652 RepID=UPI0036ADDB21
MAFVTEIVLFRDRPGVAVQTMVEAAEGSRPALAGQDGTIDRDAGRFMQVIDGPSVRLYHFRSRSL